MTERKYSLPPFTYRELCTLRTALAVVNPDHVGATETLDMLYDTVRAVVDIATELEPGHCLHSAQSWSFDAEGKMHCWDCESTKEPS